MRPGLHVLATYRLPQLQRTGLSLPDPWWGVLDVLRMLEGHDLAEPPAHQALPVVGVDALVEAAGASRDTLLRALRAELVDARHYLDHRRIPLVLLFDHTLSDPRDGTGLQLTLDGAAVPLRPLLGTRLTPAHDEVDGWWWAPQLG